MTFTTKNGKLTAYLELSREIVAVQQVADVCLWL